MNVNRQNNCCTGRPMGRTVCGNPVPVMPCCSDVAADGVIIGGCPDQSCNKETTLSGMPVAMAYVPWQSYENIYQLPQALRNGTMFRELNLDFAGRRCN